MALVHATRMNKTAQRMEEFSRVKLRTEATTVAEILLVIRGFLNIGGSTVTSIVPDIPEIPYESSFLGTYSGRMRSAAIARVCCCE